MPLTVAALEVEILNRVGGKWGQAQLSALTTGSNPDLKAPIRKGLRYVGVYPADPTAATDSDLAAVPADRAEVYMDAATLEALYAVQGRFQQGFDQKVQDQSQSLHQIMADLAAMIANYEARVPKLNLNKTSVGTLTHGGHVPGDDRRRNHWGFPFFNPEWF